MKVHIRNFFLIITVFVFMTRIYTVATEIYKVANDLSLRDFKNLFDFQGKYSVHIPLVILLQ